MDDEASVMAPIPTRAREKAEKEKRYKGSWREALAEALTPLTYAPQPTISVPATIGETAAREGLSGLMNLWESIVLPFMNRSKGVMHILGRSRGLPASTSDVQEILREGTQSRKAMDFYRATGRFIDPKGDTLEEIPDINARVTPKALKAIEDIRQWKKQYETALLQDVLDHPELYSKYPSLQKLPVEIVAKAGSEFVPPIWGDPITSGTMRIGALSKSKTPIESTLHETAHAVQELDSLMPGANPDWILKDLNALAARGEIPPAMATSSVAHIIYLLSGGEIGARAAEERRMLNRRERQGRLPTTHGGKVFSPTFPFVTPEGGIVDEAVMKSNDLGEIKRIARLLANRP